jgi:GDPmannose 4,6-dehydratase
LGTKLYNQAMKNVLITGITGQDGSYLAEQYLSDGWNVHGIVRRSSTLSRPRIDHLFSPNLDQGEQKIKLHYGDLADVSALIRIIQEVEPTQVINLAAQSHVAVSFEVPIETANITGLGAAAIFEAVRIVNPGIRIYQASSSEMYGGAQGSTLLDEKSMFDPKSPYAAAKVYAFNMAKIYRDSYGMHISNGILFNHESPRRGENFVSRKITKAVAAIKLGHQHKLYLGNLSATRDWGHARDYMIAVRDMLDAESPDDYVVATGSSHSVLEFANLAFKTADLNASDFIQVDPKFFRPNEVQDLRGNASKIYSKLGWKPQTTFENLVNEMVTSDLSEMEK